MPGRIRPRALAAAALLVAALSPSLIGAARQAPPGRTVILSIVGTNDLHGGVLARDGRGGLPLLGGYVKNLRAARARDGGAVILLDGGDMFQGTLESNSTEGAPVVAAYNTIGYTAAAIGNHEFDFGPSGPAATPAGPADDPRGALKARASEAAFPFLAANLIDAATGRPVEWRNVRPTLLTEAAGIKVGVIGGLTQEALSATIAANVQGLSVAPLARTIEQRAIELRAAGASIVLVTTHAGGRCADLTQPADPSSCDPMGEIMGVARALPPGLVDVIVGGHTHAPMAHLVNGIAIIESYAGGRAFGRIDLVVERASGKVIDRRIFPPRDLCAWEDPKTAACAPPPAPGTASTPAHYEGAPVAPDPAVTAVLAPTIEAIQAIKARPLGIQLATPIRRAGGMESPLGNLFTDALLAGVPGADVSLHNTTGGLRADLPQGPVVYGSVYEVMPFENKVVVINLTGAQLKTVIATHLSTTRRMLGMSGVHARAQCSGGRLDVALARPSGTAVRDDERLVVATIDFLATGGDAILTPVMPAGGFPVSEDAPLVRDLLAEHLRRRGDGLRENDLLNPGNPRIAYTGTRPLACEAPKF